jgi:hypothetical protein
MDNQYHGRNANIYNARFDFSNGPTGSTGGTGGVGPTGDTGPTGPPGTPAVSTPMTPFVEGIAFGETNPGRTLLGYGVDNTSNNIGLWCSSSGSPQEFTNASSSITSFFDTRLDSSQLQNGIYTGQGGDLRSSNLSNSLFMERNSILQNQTDWTENMMMLNNFTANPNDSITRSLAFMTGQFSTDSRLDQGLLIGDMTGVDHPGIFDALCLRTPGSTRNLTMGENTGYIGNGQATIVMNPGDFVMETYNSYFLKTLRPDTSSGQIAYYEPGTGELTYGAAPGSYTLPDKLPTVLGGQYGVNSLANASDVNGRNSFNNYSAGPVQLTGVSAVGNNLYTASAPGLTTFTNDIFLGRNQSFNSAQSISNSLIATNNVTGANISQINGCNLIVPSSGGLTFSYAGAVTGANFVSSGTIICASDPLYSTVISSGGSVAPGGSNLIVISNGGGGAVTMNGTGNSVILSSGASLAYNFPVGVSNSCLISNGLATVNPSASGQLCANHSTLRMPSISAVGVVDINTSPMAFSSTTGLISPTLSPLLSRVYRAVGTTTAAGQVTFTPGGSINPSTVGYSFTATVRNASTTVAYTAQIVAVSLTSVTVQVFNSVTVVLASPSMTPSGAGIIVHFQMAY